MKKTVLIALIITVLIANVAFADTDDDKINIPKDWHGKKKIVIPEGELTQVVFIKYNQPISQTNEQVVTTGPNNLYELSGLKWNLKKYPKGVPYIINPSKAVNNYRLTQSAVVSAVKNSLETWDAVTSKELYGNTPTINSRAQASTATPDYKNVISWASVSDPNVVAVAWMWYYTATNEMVDADIIFSTNYRWGIDPDGEGTAYSLSNAMDIQNVGTHESGHLTGLNDLYDSNLAAMTMYGYTSYGEVIRRSLEPGDIAGAQAVYGT